MGERCTLGSLGVPIKHYAKINPGETDDEENAVTALKESAVCKGKRFPQATGELKVCFSSNIL